MGRAMDTSLLAHIGLYMHVIVRWRTETTDALADLLVYPNGLVHLSSSKLLTYNEVSASHARDTSNI